MPELPEVERARALIEERALGRRIVAVDDSDTYVCRPHAPGEIAAALAGHTLAAAHRRGKFLWVETEAGPTLGLPAAIERNHRLAEASARAASGLASDIAASAW